jgi:triosephosphate isomerase (TIM)
MADQRRPLIAGNWKMNLTHHEAAGYLEALRGELAVQDAAAVEIALLPPFTALHTVQAFVQHHDLPVAYGAQDLSPLPGGAYTGDVAGPMLSSLGCSYVLVGHSERRQHHAEDDSTVRAKTQAAFRHGLTPVVCVGEGLQVRRAGAHVEFTLAQVRAAFAEASAHDAESAVIAYEPVWAIGTGEVATPQDAQEVCAAIRKQLGDMLSLDLSATMRIIYGGSVTANTITDILVGPDIDGALVGGASLDPAGFAAICRAGSSMAGGPTPFGQPVR